MHVFRTLRTCNSIDCVHGLQISYVMLSLYVMRMFNIMSYHCKCEPPNPTTGIFCIKWLFWHFCCTFAPGLGSIASMPPTRSSLFRLENCCGLVEKDHGD